MYPILINVGMGDLETFININLKSMMQKTPSGVTNIFHQVNNEHYK